MDRIAAHIDLMPTILDCCNVAIPEETKLDGKSLKPLVQGASGGWPNRMLFFQWHRGEPRQGWACAVRDDRWKLVQAVRPEGMLPKLRWELYDLQKDFSEQHDVSGDHADVVAAMRRAYDAWFAEMRATRNFASPAIEVGTPHEDPVVLTRQDWIEDSIAGTRNARGHWAVKLAKPTRFTALVRFNKAISGNVIIHYGSGQRSARTASPSAAVTVAGLELPPGTLDLTAWAEHAGKPIAAYQLELRMTN